MPADDGLDALTLILIIGLFCVIMVPCAIKLLHDNLGGFDVLIEKTALHTTGEIKPVQPPYDKNDVLLSMAIADRYTSKPAAIQINVDQTNGPTFTIDNTYLTSKDVQVFQANSVLQTAGTNQLKLDTYIGSTGERKWVVSK